NRGKVIFLKFRNKLRFIFFHYLVRMPLPKLSLLFYSENTSNLNLNSDVLSVQDMHPKSG
ncbi:hypothetical protein C5K27_10915, partial [Shigella flexneri]